MELDFKLLTGYVATGVEVLTAVVVALAILQATVQALSLYLHLPPAPPKEVIRLQLGKWLALALEFTVAADILRTAVAPTWDDLGKLAAIVLIRTGLNFVLHPAVEGRVTIVLDNVPWDLALDLILKNNGLDKVLEGNVIRIAPTTQLASEAAQRKQLKQAEELEVEPVTITRTLSYARARDVEQVVRDGGVLSARGKVIVTMP